MLGSTGLRKGGGEERVGGRGWCISPGVVSDLDPPPLLNFSEWKKILAEPTGLLNEIMAFRFFLCVYVGTMIEAKKKICRWQKITYFPGKKRTDTALKKHFAAPISTAETENRK